MSEDGTHRVRNNHRLGDQHNKVAPRGLLGFKIIFCFTTVEHLLYLIPALVFSCLSGLVRPAVTILIGRYLNTFSVLASGSGDLDTLKHQNFQTLTAIFVLAGATWVIKTGFCTLWVAYGEGQAQAVREELFLTLIDRDLEWFDSQDTGVNTILTRLHTQISDFQKGVSQPLGLVVTAVAQIAGGLVVAFLHSWKLSLVLVATLPIITTAMSLLASGTQARIQKEQIILTSATKQAAHSFQNIAFVISSGMKVREYNQYLDSLAALTKVFREQVLRSSQQAAFIKFAATSVIVLSLFYGAHLIHVEHSSTGAIITTFQCCAIVSASFNDLLVQLLALERGQAAALVLTNLLRRVRKGKLTCDRIKGRTPSVLEGDIEVRAVTFAYPTQPSLCILKDVSLHFPAHEMTFVIGNSGSGKSTLGALLLAFYSPTSGSIYIDGHKIEKLEAQWLRNNVTLVQQDSFLFKGTIADNIGISPSDVDSVGTTPLQQAIELAYLQEVVLNLPEGLQTIIGRGGATLSGGQRQRVAIARARFRNSPVLILDESTSALDEHVKAVVMQNIRKWRQDKTTIIITHDLSQIMPGDFVCVLKNGRLVTEGYHAAVKAVLEKTEDHELIGHSTSLVSSVSHLDDAHAGQRVRPMIRPALLRSPSVASTITSDETQDDSDTGYASSETNLLVSSQSSNRSRFRRTVLQKILPQRRHTEVPPAFSNDNKEDRFSNADALHMDGDYELLQTSRTRRLHNRLTLAGPYKPLGQQTGVATSTPYEPQNVDMPIAYRASAVWHEMTVDCADNRSSITEQAQEQAVTEPGMLELLKTVWEFLPTHDRGLLIVAMGVITLCAALPSAIGWTMVQMLATFHQSSGWAAETRKWSCVLFSLAWLDAVLAFGSTFLFPTLAEAWSSQFRRRAFLAVLHQPKSWFDRETFSTDATCRLLSHDPPRVSQLLASIARFGLTVIIMLLVAITWSMIAYWKLTLIALAFAPVFLATGKLFSWTSARWEKRTYAASEAVAELFSETFTDIRTVRALSLQSKFHRQYSSAVTIAYQLGLKRGIYTGMCFGLSESVVLGITGLIFYCAFQMAQSKEASFQSVMTVLTLLLFAIMSAATIAALIPSASGSIASGGRLLQLVRMNTVDGSESGDHIRMEQFDGSIEFRGLVFSYPTRPEVQVLRGLNLRVPGSQSVSIVGPSGCGKSTVIQLLLTLYRTPDNSLFISKHDTMQLNLRELRTRIAYVPQQPIVLPMSIRSNIFYGLHDDSTMVDSLLVTAASAAGIHDFVTSLPNGYETIVGDGGLALSGGQAQRVALARAFARQPRIFLMDEPTSALDRESTEIVKESIRRLHQGKNPPTIVIATHSRDMMQLTDRTVVLENGQVVEDGKYEALLVQKGKLWSLLNTDGIA